MSSDDAKTSEYFSEFSEPRNPCLFDNEDEVNQDDEVNHDDEEDQDKESFDLQNLPDDDSLKEKNPKQQNMTLVGGEKIAEYREKRDR